MKLAQLLLLKKLIFIHWTSVKINGITNLTHKVIFKTWSFPAWDKFCFPSRCALTCFDFRRQRAGVWFPSVTVFQMRAPRFGCHRSKWQFCLRILQIFWIIRQVVSLDGESLDSWATTSGCCMTQRKQPVSSLTNGTSAPTRTLNSLSSANAADCRTDMFWERSRGHNIGPASWRFVLIRVA